MIEGTLKLYLCVYYNDYSDDIYAHRVKNDELQEPDSLTLEKIRIFFNNRDLWSKEWNEYVLNVQKKRNAIHAFQDKEIGTFEEFYECLPAYLAMISKFNLGLPYPYGVPNISTDLIPLMDKLSKIFDSKRLKEAEDYWENLFKDDEDKDLETVQI